MDILMLVGMDADLGLEEAGKDSDNDNDDRGTLHQHPQKKRTNRLASCIG
jgi:hypothetical protein